MKLVKKDAVTTTNAAGIVLSNGVFWAHPQEQCDDGSLITDIGYWERTLRKIGFKPDWELNK